MEYKPRPTSPILKPVEIEHADFVTFRDYLQSFAGIYLSDNKEYLVSTRLRRILSDHGLKSLKELNQLLTQPAVDRRLRQQIIDAMTTNETFWFRDQYPYKYLRETIFPETFRKNPISPLRIWSAACSSGQEPYSISIIAEEFIRGNSQAKNYPVDILATDISSQILQAATKAHYDRLSISRGMSDERLRQYFDSLDGDIWQVKDFIKKRVSFKPINLQDSFVSMGKFDLVFCRNVLIYFTADLKTEILRRIHATMQPGGYLFLGSSESMSSVSDAFDMVHCKPGVVYRAR